MCEYPPRADTAKKSDAFALQETDNYWHLGSKQPLLKLWQSTGRGGEQPLEAGPHVLLLPAAPGAVGKCGCAGECGSCGSGGVGRVGGMTVLCFYLSPG